MTKVLVCFVVVATAALAQARPGGGNTYHSSSSSSAGTSSSFGGGGFSSSSNSFGGGFSSSPSSDDAWMRHDSSSSSSSSGDVDPRFVIGFVIVAIVFMGGFYVYDEYISPRWNSHTFVANPTRRALPPSFGALLVEDRDFSLTVFEDFTFALFAEAHRSAGSQPAAYLSPVASAHLAARNTEVVQQVVIGSLHVDGVSTSAAPADPHVQPQLGDQPHHSIAVRVESNIDFENATMSCVEHWLFIRDPGVRSRPPVRTHTWPCPSCGAPWTAGADPRTCASCGQHITSGRFDWTVDQIWVESSTRIGPTLTGTVEEQGTERSTIVDPEATRQLVAITASDPNVTLETVTARAGMIYKRVNDAWNTANIAAARGVVTRSMHDYLRYWIEAYKRQHLANHLDDAGLADVKLAKVVRDRYFDAITLRIFASGLDYTADAKHHVVAGSKTERRAYSEYWTFLRSSTRKGPVGAEPACPNCGAPLAIADSGACEHCSAEVDNGSFDFVLSKIEQDDCYLG